MRSSQGILPLYVVVPHPDTVHVRPMVREPVRDWEGREKREREEGERRERDHIRKEFERKEVRKRNRDGEIDREEEVNEEKKHKKFWNETSQKSQKRQHLRTHSQPASSFISALCMLSSPSSKRSTSKVSSAMSLIGIDLTTYLGWMIHLVGLCVCVCV